MPHSFPKDVVPAEIKWGRPPGLRGTPSSRSFDGFSRLSSRRGRPGGRPQTWASAPPFMQIPGNRENYAALGTIACPTGLLAMNGQTRNSEVARRTTAGRSLPPGDRWNSIRIRTTSPGRSVMYRQLVYRVIVNVRRLKFVSTCCPPGGIVHGEAPPKHYRKRLSRRHLRCDLGPNRNLAVRREFACRNSSL
jgi:hypothetical protein